MSSISLPSLVKRKCKVRDPSSCIVAVPVYGMDGLASDGDGLMLSAKDALLAASVSRMTNFSEHRIGYVLFDVRSPPGTDDTSGLRIIVLAQDLERWRQIKGRRAQIEVSDLAVFDVGVARRIGVAGCQEIADTGSSELIERGSDRFVRK